MSEERRVAKAAGIVSAATLLSRVLGFVRDMVMAKVFGAGMVADAFFVGFRIPNLLRELFAEGSMSAAFIPVFTDYTTKKSKEDAWRMASASFTILFLILICITALGILAAPWIVRAIAPGFHDIPEKFTLTAELTRIMFPYLVFIGLAALMMGILNSMRSFAAPALSPVMLNVAMITAALVVAPMMEQPIVALAIGVVVGGMLQFAVQLPALWRVGERRTEASLQ
ncbi:MAG: murein biosynthesis integral membrane protein MurJ, partial [Nitrospirota bacterium]|nr:murein biosynthesis integral membrane protein MurJ [Nitrospirota bacterium]